MLADTFLWVSKLKAQVTLQLLNHFPFQLFTATCLWESCQTVWRSDIIKKKDGIHWLHYPKGISIATKVSSMDNKIPFIHFLLMYHCQQNKWYPHMCLLVHFEATLDFSRSEFTCP